jgi:hypothetical protein
MPSVEQIHSAGAIAYGTLTAYHYCRCLAERKRPA